MVQMKSNGAAETLLVASGAFAPGMEVWVCLASRKPKAVIGSGDSWITLAFGRDVKLVGEVMSDCKTCR